SGPPPAGAPAAPGAPVSAGDPSRGDRGDRGDRERGIPSCIPSPVAIAGGNAPPPPTIRETGVMAASELPDYRPPFTNGAVRPDADGNLWIRTIQTKPVPGGAIYDIVSRQGELVDRLQLPQGYQP